MFIAQDYTLVKRQKCKNFEKVQNDELLFFYCNHFGFF